MKKNRIKDLRRLRLNRETIRLLSDPTLLGVAGGGSNTELSRPCCVTDSCIVQNCIPTDCSGRTSATEEA
jgi:hypothetical protein